MSSNCTLVLDKVKWAEEFSSTYQNKHTTLPPFPQLVWERQLTVQQDTQADMIFSLQLKMIHFPAIVHCRLLDW